MADKRLKIFVDAHCFDAEYQGSRTFVKEIYKAMAAKKDLLLYLGARDTNKLREHFPCADNVVFLQYKMRSRLFRLAYDIPRLIKKHRIDVAHFQYVTPLYKNCKQIVTIHDVIFNDYPGEFSTAYRLVKKFLFKRAVRTADVLTTVSAFSKASIQKHLETNGRPVHVIANGVDENFFEAYDKAQAKEYVGKKYGFDKFILYVSRLEPRKNHAALLRAFLELKAFEKGYRLVFIGHQSLPVPELVELLNKVPVAIRRFIFFGANVSEEELLRFYQAASVFVYPSKAEGFGIPPLEAGAAGVPVVCSASSAMKDFHFFGDYHIDATDYSALKATLQKAIGKEHDAIELQNISACIRQTYSWEASAEKLYQLIKQNQ